MQKQNLNQKQNQNQNVKTVFLGEAIEEIEVEELKYHISICFEINLKKIKKRVSTMEFEMMLQSELELSTNEVKLEYVSVWTKEKMMYMEFWIEKEVLFPPKEN